MKKTLSWIPAILLIVGGIALYVYANKIEAPLVGEEGEISGTYSLASVMSLGENYRCNFDKKDDNSAVTGTIFTDGKNVQAQFRIITDLLDQEFNSFLIFKDGSAYTWTSLGDVGYKTKPADSASRNASPSEQAQIVGLKDKMQYECEKVSDLDPTTFDPPAWVTFKEL